MPNRLIPLSKLLEVLKKGGKESREAKTDTLLALDRKQMLSNSPFRRVKEPPRLGIKLPTRNEVVMTASDSADRDRLEKLLEPLSIGEVLRSKRRPAPKR